ncbi:dynamin family protein [Exiguobacterium sp. TRN 1102]|uniref:dynamin family protein n=1 Tax=Exiguobacterium sp. TRN 1102 TaxID=3420732 RepID=UPI003D78AA13
MQIERTSTLINESLMETVQQELSLLEREEKEFASLFGSLQDQTVRVGVFGSFSVGKSELLNRIIGKSLLPTHTNESTTILTTIGYGEPEIHATTTDGEIEFVSSEEFSQYVASGTQKNWTSIHIATSELANQPTLQLVDTPGRNTKYAHHISMTEEAMLRCDAAIYVMSWQGLTAEDILYLKQLIPYQPNLYFVINKIDHLSETSLQEVMEHTTNQLVEELGKYYPIVAVSAKTGAGLSQVTEQLIPDLVTNTQALKESRFVHAMIHWLDQVTVRLEQDLYLQKLSADETGEQLQEAMERVHLQKNQLNEQVEIELSKFHESLKQTYKKMKEIIEEQLEWAKNQLGSQLMTKLDENVAQEVLIELRRNVHDSVKREFDGLLSGIRYTLQPIEGDVTVSFNAWSFDEFQQAYDERRQRMVEEHEAKLAEIAIVESGSSAETVQILRDELEKLQDMLHQPYEPVYVVDESFDPHKMEKTMKMVGRVADIGAAVALAVMTSGASAAAQVGGKVAAKEVGKATGKAIAKESLKAGAKKTGEQIAKEAMKAAARQQAKQTAKVITKTLVEETAKRSNPNDASMWKALDQITSPLETVAVRIGKSMDADRQQDMRIDYEHQARFHAERQQVLHAFTKKQELLDEMLREAGEKETLKQKINQKRQYLQDERERQLQQLEREEIEAMKKAETQHIQEQVEGTVDRLIREESEAFEQWLQLETLNIQRVMEEELPRHYREELGEWEERLTKLKNEESTERVEFDASEANIERQIAYIAQLKTEILQK